MEDLQIHSIDVPMDMYQSATEILIIMPLGGVSKESITIKLINNCLFISGIRILPVPNDKYMIIHDQCFWGEFEKKIDLPESVYFDKIYSELSSDNILTIIIPKVIIPSVIDVLIK